MAHRTTLEADRGTKPAKVAKRNANGGDRERTFEAFRRWGYLQANLDPLGFLKPLDYPDLDFSGEIADEARQHYCGSIGADFMHLAQPERRSWIAERMEAEPEEPLSSERPQVERGHRVADQDEQRQVQHDPQPRFAARQEQHRGEQHQPRGDADEIGVE